MERSRIDSTIVGGALKVEFAGEENRVGMALLKLAGFQIAMKGM